MINQLNVDKCGDRRQEIAKNNINTRKNIKPMASKVHLKKSSKNYSNIFIKKCI